MEMEFVKLMIEIILGIGVLCVGNMLIVGTVCSFNNTEEMEKNNEDEIFL